MPRKLPGKLLITRGALRGILIAYVAILFAYGWMFYNQHKQDQQQAANRRAIVYICSTTTVLDSLVVTAADQIHGSLRNGTYKRLLKAGVITQENIDDAEATLHKYRKAHVKLANVSACAEVSGRP